MSNLFLSASEAARFASRYHKNSSGGCWLWQGPLDDDGYGHFWLRRKTRSAHRVAFYAAYGEIPAGYEINHTCRNRHCVNPQHLEALTPKEHKLRDTSSIPYVNSRKTHCPRGHAYDREYGKQRYCSICENAKKRRLRAKWRAEDTLNV